jgi:hypothetical protein
MEVYLGSGGVAPLILDLGTTWRWVVNFTPRPLYFQGKSPWYPLDMDPRTGMDTVVKKKIPTPCRDSNPRSFSP